MFVAAIAAGALATSSGSPGAIVVTADVRSAERHTVRLSPAQMLKLAESAETSSDPATAAAIYAALERNPDPDIRAEARYRHAKQLLADNRNRDAALLLRRLLDEKPDAVVPRLELAHALQLLGDTDAALRELRAAEASGLPPAVARIVDRYSQALRASRPMGASLEIALAPDSNINRDQVEHAGDDLRRLRHRPAEQGEVRNGPVAERPGL